jgi:crotonobetainyl-CoA:carnitine CoA-transferase CaiB-like acyl-CoA transferase
MEGVRVLPPATNSLLGGLRVLDFSTFLAGPFASMLLADMGADIIKVEPPAGDNSRQIPPYFLGEDSAYFLSVNRNKRSITLDLTLPSSRDIVDTMVAGSDVVIDNLRSESRRNCGIDYERLSRINPRIIGCSITGFGSDGPSRGRPAYDMVAQALSGVMGLTGEPGRLPVRAGVPIGDLIAGMYAVMGVLAALEDRHRTGTGQHVDIAMMDGQMSLLSYLLTYFSVSGSEPGPQGRGHRSIPTYDTFAAADDRQIVVTANTEEMWRNLCRGLGIAEYADDPRFARNPERLRNRAELRPILDAAFATRPAGHWLSVLGELDVPCAPINGLADLGNDPQVAFRDMLLSFQYRDAGTFQAAGNPVKTSRRYPGRVDPPPGRDEHRAEILKEFGLTDPAAEGSP